MPKETLIEKYAPHAKVFKGLTGLACHGILTALRKSGKLKLNALVEPAGMSQPGTGKALKKMVAAGLIQKMVEEKGEFYSIRGTETTSIVDGIMRLSTTWPLSAMAAHLANPIKLAVLHCLAEAPNTRTQLLDKLQVKPKALFLNIRQLQGSGLITIAESSLKRRGVRGRAGDSMHHLQRREIMEVIAKVGSHLRQMAVEEAELKKGVEAKK